MSQPVIPSPYNQILAQKHVQLQNAKRFALTTLCDPATGEPKLTGKQIRKQLKFIAIDAAASGDNIIIPPSAGVKQILELVAWNVTGQTLIWQQGSTASLNSIRLTRLTDFPDLTGFVLGFNGNFDMAHWEIDNGQPLVLNLQNGTQVDGFVRYRVQNGTY